MYRVRFVNGSGDIEPMTSRNELLCALRRLFENRYSTYGLSEPLDRVVERASVGPWIGRRSRRVIQARQWSSTTRGRA